jgi:two-component system NarL family response regulator
MVKVVVVHQTFLIGNIIASVLSDETDITVVGRATTVDEAMSYLQAGRCNMFLVSAKLPDNGALKLTEVVTNANPAVKVLVTGLPESKNIILQYVMAGAAGYVLEDVSVEHLLDHIRAAHDDRALVSPEMAAALMGQITELAYISSQDRLDTTAVTDLTSREREVLNLIGEGMTNQEIADHLFIEVGTVKNHVHNLLKKLDVGSREDAAAYLPYLEE